MNSVDVHVILPNDIDDPATPSGGNVYDRRICDGLRAAGRPVHEHAVQGTWPQPGAAHRADLARVLAALPDQAVVVIDGLIASAVPDVLAPQARRLRLVLLMHMPLGTAQEEQALRASAAVITTSRWCRARLIDLYAHRGERIHVAEPGVDAAPLAEGSADGSRLLCVAAITPHKGHDVLVDALATIPDLPWDLVCAGSLDRDPGFVGSLRQRIRAAGLSDRIRLAGPRTGEDLEAHFAAADLLVLASWGETYGMVVTEALAHGIPVLATDASGLPEALGHAPDGSLPGMLTPPGDPAAMAGVLRRWLREPELRRRLRQSARDRRSTLTGWDVTSERVGKVLSAVAAHPGAMR
jgi:glycosyltransferase involved in cell wall biosynthesis